MTQNFPNDTFTSGLLLRLQAMEKEIKSLKGRLTKVSNRVDDINMLGLQEQLNFLNTQAKALLQDHLAARRILAENTLAFMYGLTKAMAMTAPATTPPEVIASVLDYVMGSLKAAVLRIQDSTQPEAITQETMLDWLAHFQDVDVRVQRNRHSQP